MGPSEFALLVALATLVAGGVDGDVEWIFQFKQHLSFGSDLDLFPLADHGTATAASTCTDYRTFGTAQDTAEDTSDRCTEADISCSLLAFGGTRLSIVIADYRVRLFADKQPVQLNLQFAGATQLSAD